MRLRKATEAKTTQEKRLSRRQWLRALLGSAAVLSLGGAAPLRRARRQRRLGETVPTGWFGHC